MVNRVGKDKYGNLEDVDLGNFLLKSIQQSYNICDLPCEKHIEAYKILIKIKRDLIAICNTIISDMNLQKDGNHQMIKKQVQELFNHMYSELDYIEFALEYEESEQIEEVLERLLDSEYANTKYDINQDYEFWKDQSTFFQEGPLEQSMRLYGIHNSELALKTAILFVSSLEYQEYRKNNWSRGYSNYTLRRVSCRHLGYAREKFRKDRNGSLRKLYDVFSFVHSISSILADHYCCTTHDRLYDLSYNIEKSQHVIIHKEANDFQKKLVKSTNASCWNKD